jgi:eukaryotic-like serine/threonine-protein kinase
MLNPGVKLGPYEIVGQLGAGGMGEVYRARDTRLDRTVAVKILREHLSSAEARQRFDREARTISALSHPHVCHLYDVGEQEGTSYLVMEYLEGETLADRLRKGPLPLDQVLKLGVEICEGLEAAHKNGVVHRDLKPGNIMLTRSGAKLLDFGLAKPLQAAPPSSGLTQTLTTPQHPVTMEGMVVGTFQYMSPEQVEGKEADARSDIFALGAVLHEMVTGKRAFEGKTTASTIAAILAAEPPTISSLQPLSPALLEGTITACLGKDADERIQTAHEVKLRLQWIAQTGAASGAGTVAPPVAPSNRAASWVAGLLALVVVAGGGLWWTSAHRTQPTMYFSSPMALAANDVALSPDGKTVAMVAFSEAANKYMLWTYRIGARGAVVVPGTEEASHPFWSADGNAIGFFAQFKLKTVEAFTGRPSQSLADAPFGRGGAWNKEGTIIYTPDVRAGLYRIPASGGTPTPITQPDASQMEQSHRWPAFLPDQHHFLYLAANFGGRVESDKLMVGSIDSEEKHRLLKASSNAAYAEPGYLLYWQDGALMAQPFDAKTFALSGQARALFEGVQYFPATQLAVFAVSGPATLVAQTGKGADKSQLVWFDRSGKRLADLGPPGHYGNPALSPDGRRLAFEQTEPDGRHVDIWIRELASDAAARMSFRQGLNEQPVWSRDGKTLAFSSDADVGWGLSQKNADGSGEEERVLPSRGGRIMFWDWAPDGKARLVGKDEALFYLQDSKTDLTPLLQANGTARNAQFSPDGKWFAYSSKETGNWEIYVSPFPAVGSKWLVSRGGGTEPRWRRDGKEMFYLSADGKITAVPVKLGATFESGTPFPLFQPRLRQPISALDVCSYDVSADGQRFLINTKVDAPSAAPLSVVLNWQKEIE